MNSINKRNALQNTIIFGIGLVTLIVFLIFSIFSNKNFGTSIIVTIFTLIYVGLFTASLKKYIRIKEELEN